MQELIDFYKKYKAIIVPSLFLLGALIIFLQIMFPLLSTIGSLQGQVGDEQKKLSDYTNSVTVLRSLDATQMSQKVGIAINALPPSKDIQSIYLAITSSATKANIQLSGFTVSLGDIFGKDNSPQPSIGVPFVVVTVKLDGVNASNLVQFSNALAHTVPLSKIINVSVNGGSGNADIQFYYKPYDLVEINKNVMTPLTPAENTILDKLPQP